MMFPMQYPVKMTAVVNVFLVNPPTCEKSVTTHYRAQTLARTLTLFEIMTSVSENPTDCRIPMSQGPSTDMYDERMPYLEARKAVCYKPVRSLLLRQIGQASRRNDAREVPQGHRDDTHCPLSGQQDSEHDST